jgi:hypothetical protein
VPAYLATAGRPGAAPRQLDRLSQLHNPDGRVPPTLRPEERRLLELLRPGPLTLAEAAAHLRLPVSVVRVLVADLTAAGHLLSRPPVPAGQPPARALLEKVLDGLRSLKSP